MKKITLMVLGIAAFMAVSCGEKKETEATTETEASEPTTEEVVVESGASDYDAVLGKYEQIVDQHIAILKKVQAGDTAAMADAQKLTDEMVAIAGDLQKFDATKITEAQKAKFQAIADKYQKALMP